MHQPVGWCAAAAVKVLHVSHSWCLSCDAEVARVVVSKHEAPPDVGSGLLLSDKDIVGISLRSPC